jgi:hypothetical protein
MLSGVWPGVQDAQRDVAQADLASLLDGGVGEACSGSGMDVDSGARLLGQGLVAGDVIGVEMGLHDTRDREPLSTPERDVLVDAVPGGIDHRGLPTLSAPDQVREAARFLVDELLKDHVRFSHSAVKLRKATRAA